MRVDGIIFDMDGTLLDSMHIWRGSGANYLLSLGKTPEPDLNDILRTKSLAQGAQYLISRYGLEKTQQEVIDGINRLIADFYINEAQPKPGVKEFLEQMSARGVKMCIATLTDYKLSQLALKRCGLLPYFNKILTCYEIGCSKDNPAIYNAALKILDTKREYTYVFEDALYAAKTAKEAGFNVVGVYDNSSKDHQQQLKALCDIYIESFEQARDYFD